MSRALMVQATSSDAGKSVIVAGLCRAFSRRGLRVKPFKSQNMSNNAAVVEGGEIGRAQFLQAKACYTEPDTRMNPILLKPQSDCGSQLIIRGKLQGCYRAMDYREISKSCLHEAVSAYDSLAKEADLIIVEGAGSAGEVNLRQHDIANMGFATHRNIPVVVAGDIERGGVIAALIGLQKVLDKSDNDLIKGFIINKFRGEADLFKDGLDYIIDKTGWRCFGVLPYLSSVDYLPAEDSVVLERLVKPRFSTAEKGKIHIVIPRLPRISNFDDFDPLRFSKGVTIEFVPSGRFLPRADLIIIPGTKSTIDDLRFMFAQGWDIDIKAHVRRGGRVLGICGGYQMLGRTICDPHGIETTKNDRCDGLGLLDIKTVFSDKKKLAHRHLKLTNGLSISGYEIHIGSSFGNDCKKPFLACSPSDDVGGATSPDGRVGGVYLHGLFANDDFRCQFLQSFNDFQPQLDCFDDKVEKSLDNLADHCERHLDLSDLYSCSQQTACDRR